MSKKNIIDIMILKDYEYSMFLDKLYNKRDLEYFVRCAKTKHALYKRFIKEVSYV